MHRSLPVACLLLLSFSAHAGLTKWVDAEGKVHYSDEPPPANVNAKVLAVPKAASGVPAEKTYVEQEAERKKALKNKAESEQKAAKQQEDAAAKQKYCASLRSHLATLEKGSRLATYNEKGESVIMDDAARQQQIEEARKQLSANCNY